MRLVAKLGFDKHQFRFGRSGAVVFLIFWVLHEYLALSLRVVASLMSVVALAALVLRAASVIGLS